MQVVWKTYSRVRIGGGLSYSGESPRIWTSEWCAGYTVPASYLLTLVLAMTVTLSECQEPVSVAGVHHSTVM